MSVGLLLAGCSAHGAEAPRSEASVPDALEPSVSITAVPSRHRWHCHHEGALEIQPLGVETSHQGYPAEFSASPWSWVAVVASLQP